MATNASTFAPAGCPICDGVGWVLLDLLDKFCHIGLSYAGSSFLCFTFVFFASSCQIFRPTFYSRHVEIQPHHLPSATGNHIKNPAPNFHELGIRALLHHHTFYLLFAILNCDGYTASQAAGPGVYSVFAGGYFACLPQSNGICFAGKCRLDGTGLYWA